MEFSKKRSVSGSFISSKSTSDIFKAQFQAKLGTVHEWTGSSLYSWRDKVLENVRLQSHVECQIEVVIVIESLTVVTPPHF